MKIKINYEDKKIQNVKVGDYVVSFDTENDNFRHNAVTETHLPIVEKERQLKLISKNGAILITSTTHPMCYLTDDNKWDYKPSCELVVGDIVKPENGDKTTVYKILIGDEIDDEIDEQFYDITVNNDNNYLAGENDKIVIHNSATTYFPFWHLEIEDILVLKNNKGTDNNRVRKLDYGVQFSRLFYKRFVKNESITLFSPHEVPELYEAFGNNDLFDEIYEKCERKTSIRKKKIKARDLFNQFCQERIGTGRMYVQNIDHANEHSAFLDKINMSNLCLKGDTNIPVRVYDLDKNGVDYFNLTYNDELDCYEGDMSIKDITMLYEISYIESYEIEGQQVMRAQCKIEVLSYNINKDINEYKTVMKAIKTGENKEVIKITDENNNSVICTEEHPIYTKNRGYVKAIELEENDTLLILENYKNEKNLEFNLI